MAGTGSVVSITSNDSTSPSVAMTCQSHQTLRRPGRRPSLDPMQEEGHLQSQCLSSSSSKQQVEHVMEDTDDDSSCSSEHTQVTSNTNPNKSSVGHLGDHSSHQGNTHCSSTDTQVTSNCNTQSNDVTNTRPFVKEAVEPFLLVPNGNDLQNSFSLSRVSVDMSMDASMNTKTSAMTELTGLPPQRAPLKHERWGSGEPKASASTSSHRKSSSSTGSKTSSKTGSMGSWHSKTRRKSKEHRATREREPLQFQDNDVIDMDHPDDSFDLQSKPAMVGVQITTLEEESEFLVNEDAEDDDDVNPIAAGSVGGTRDSGSSTCSVLLLTKDRVRSYMVDYYADYDSIFRHGKTSKACWEAFFQQYFTQDVQWVRSTGNPIGREGLALLLSEDIIGISMSIVSIDSIQLLAGGLAAVVVFTADQEYLDRGKPEADRTVISSVLSVVNGCDILISHEHRCVGKPIPKESRWES
jgi:Protein of unknown function (DUF3804)